MFGRLNCRLAPMCFNRPKAAVNNVQNCVSVALLTNKMSFSSTVNNLAKFYNYEPKKWLKHNDTIFPPQEHGEERRPAYICHQAANIKYSPKKMWYVACFVRGMTVDEALKQLPLVGRKGATIVRDTILEAQKLAVEKHHVEFKTNLWIAESFCSKGPIVKGIRRHARQRIGEVMYRYCHYYVRLEEGEPPKEYYYSWPKTGPALLAQWMDEVRDRKIEGSL